MIEDSSSIENLINKNPQLRKKLSEGFYQNNISNTWKEIPTKSYKTKASSDHLSKQIY